MAKRTKVPRASIACTILDDPDFIGIMQDGSGRQAFALFCAMLAAAKAQDNGGRFEQPSVIVAVMVRWPLAEFNIALKDLAERTDWVVATDATITIRSFKKWNSWGGKRDASGAPSGNQNARKIQSENNQVAPKIQPNIDVPVSVSVSLTDSKDKDTSVSDKPKRVRKPSFADNWLPEFRKLLAFDLEDRRCCIALNKLKGVAGEKALTTLIGQLQNRGWRGENPEHVWAYMGAALKSKSPVEHEPIYEDKID